MDQIFDRLGNLLKSWLNDGDDGREKPFGDPDARRTGDGYFDDAMDELNAFLSEDRAKQEKLARDREERARAEAEARARTSRPSGPPRKLVDAYRTLGLEPGATFEKVRSAYKRLLKEHHPDRHGDSPEKQKKATETAARINDAYRVIETWHDTGTLGDE